MTTPSPPEQNDPRAALYTGDADDRIDRNSVENFVENVKNFRKALDIPRPPCYNPFRSFLRQMHRRR